MKPSENMNQVREAFYLTNDGCWEQQYVYKYAAINGLDPDCGIKLLDLLNNETRIAQIQHGILEDTILQGTRIVNNLNKQIYPNIKVIEGYPSVD